MIKYILFCICLILLLSGCVSAAQPEDSGSLPESEPPLSQAESELSSLPESSSQPEESSLSLQSETSSYEVSLSSHIEPPSSANPGTFSSPVTAGSQSTNSESASALPSQAKIEFAKSDDNRLQFSTSAEAVGNENDLENCKNALNDSLDVLGLLVVYNGEDGPKEYTDEFIEEILDIYRRTDLRTIDEIFEQNPGALTRGVAAAAFYDKEGNRVWVVRTIGDLFRVELEDDRNVHVFRGTLGCQ